MRHALHVTTLHRNPSCSTYTFGQLEYFWGCSEFLCVVSGVLVDCGGGAFFGEIFRGYPDAHVIPTHQNLNEATPRLREYLKYDHVSIWLFIDTACPVKDQSPCEGFSVMLGYLGSYTVQPPY